VSVALGGESDETHSLLLDSCQLLNLYATRRIKEIIRALGRRVFVTNYTVAREAKWVGSGRVADPTSDVEWVEVKPLLEDGVISLTEITGEDEADLYIELAAVMDDGEAIAGAIAISRGMHLGTDDRRARAKFRKRVPPLVTVTTSDLILTWATERKVSASDVAGTLRLIRERARFIPGSEDPLAEWWKNAESL
jgi:predicted nucleic acid-binding protein